jgi:hypothetical protein
MTCLLAALLVVLPDLPRPPDGVAVTYLADSRSPAASLLLFLLPDGSFLDINGHFVRREYLAPVARQGPVCVVAEKADARLMAALAGFSDGNGRSAHVYILVRKHLSRR